MSLPDGFTTTAHDAIPLYVVTRLGYVDWRTRQPAPVRSWLDAQAFDGSPGSAATLPTPDGAIAAGLIGVEDLLDPYAYGHAPFSLPARRWALATSLGEAEREALELGWGLGAYRFSRYKAPLRPASQLVVDASGSETRDVLLASLRVRDMVNTPTEHMGPDQIEQIARDIAQAHGATLEVIAGEDLLTRNFPAIHAVGRASHRAPRLIGLHWGKDTDPCVAIVGKGVCFDSGGLDIKPADGMRNMKKDMGGAAHAIALAELIMARKLPVRLSLLVPAVENSIGPESFRPGEVVSTRKGIMVEIDNTDAEGRVILADALTYAGEQNPELILDFATLTGAARIALGPDLPALFSNDDAIANEWLAAGDRLRDPLWRMPLWRPYLRYLTSNIADMANAGSKMAGSVTAALYLERFIPEGRPWAHLDVYAWSDTARPGRPPGGEALGLRSAFAMLKGRYPA